MPFIGSRGANTGKSFGQFSGATPEVGFPFLTGPLNFTVTTSNRTFGSLNIISIK